MTCRKNQCLLFLQGGGGGKCHHFISVIIMKVRAPSPAPACGLSACQIPAAACDGQPVTPYLATSLTDVPHLLDPFGAQENPHPQSKEAGRRRALQRSCSEEQMILPEWGMRRAHTQSISIQCHQSVRVAGVNAKAEPGNH